MANALAEVQDTFVSLNANYTMLRVACRSDAERQELADRYTKAQAEYYDCVNKMLSDDDAEVATLCKELTDANKGIKNSIQMMGEISKVIDIIDTALNIGAQLLVKAGVAL